MIMTSIRTTIPTACLRLRIAFLLLLVLLLSACTTPITLPRTTVEEPLLLDSMRTPIKKLIFISEAEANCPTQCADAISGSSGFRRFVSHIEKRLTQNGFSLISGDIVSRVESVLGDSETRELWGRTEKALLLGSDTGADGIFEVRALFIDQTVKSFLKEAGDKTFSPKPLAYAERITNENPSAARFSIPVWEATVEARMLDINGNVVWSGAKTVRTTDILPEDWKASLNNDKPLAHIAREFIFFGSKDQNFDYYLYYHDPDLQKKQINLIIDDLIQHLADAQFPG